ncbi:MAG: holo-ACP synthase [Elusimicrobiales bacterium]|nr:holo-ACP synthase [Elusimicrobiales bacterium]
MKVGIDIIDTKRIKRLIKNKRFLNKVFSNREIKYCESFKDNAQRYAARFAAKEAYIKCISNKKIPSLNKIEILNKKDGNLEVLIDGRKDKCLVSISHIKDYAIAVCIREYD